MADLNEGADESDEAGDPSEPNLLEGKYRQQMRQIHPQKIEIPISTLLQMIKEQITLNPEFQRRDRWDIKKRSRFIESVIMNVPIPPVFLGEDEYGSYVVLDGRQRLTALHEFLRNGYSLQGLTVWDELNGLNFSELEKRKLDRTLTRRFVPAVLLLKESSPEVKYDVFDRLNTGGVRANEMEIRNAVFHGPFTKLIHKLSGLSDFRALWDIPQDDAVLSENSTYQTMDDLEYVLRYFALSDPQAMEGRFKEYLSDYMKARNGAYGIDKGLASSDEERFTRAVRATLSVLGANAFLRESPDKKLRRSAPLADAILYGMTYLDTSKLAPGDSKNIAAALAQLHVDSEYKKAVSQGTNGKGAIIRRLTMARNAISKAVPHAISA